MVRVRGSAMHRNGIIVRKVFNYNGIKQNGWISPIDLAKYNVVLCDYETMNSEIYYTNPAGTMYNIRVRKTITPRSPLLKLNWFRVVLDEAQMVESPNKSCTRMVKKLPAVNRWAVTGTPIEKSVDDLYGLMVFLDYEPYTNRSTWNSITNAFNSGNARPLIDGCLKNIMWRTSKANVADEMDIPQQQEIIHRVKMNELEARYYFDQHSKFEQEFDQTVCKVVGESSSGLKMNSRTLKLIMQPLQKLRQDCTVPTVKGRRVSNGLCRFIKTRSDLHKLMVKENENKCKQELEVIVRTAHWIAQSELQTHNITAAIATYTGVLNLMQVCRDNSICINSMTPLAALRNFMEFPIPSEKTKKECLMEIERLEREHLKVVNDSLKTIRTGIFNWENDIRIRSNNYSIMRWWSDFLNVTDKKVEILGAIKRQLKDDNVNLTSFHDVRCTLNSWLQSISRERSNLRTMFNEHDFLVKTMKPPLLLSEETLAQIDDHSDEIGNEISKHDRNCLLCLVCDVTSVLENYKYLLFTSTENYRKRSYQETMLREIHNFMQDDQWILTANKHFELIDLLKREYKDYRNYLQKINDGIYVSRRLRLSQIIKLQSNLTQLNSERESAGQRINKHFQTLKYVKHLEKNKQPGDEECPICMEFPTSIEWVLECGHKMCFTCSLEIKKTHPREYRCHSCRNVQKTVNSYLVYVQPTAGPTIIGDPSTKVREIVRTALNLLKADPNVKILIFSHWNDILEVIAAALSANGIQKQGKYKTYQDRIDEFKDKDRNVTCLLLPLAYGSKGLNLVEATHVFLIEPILDPADELQAIGRIHRIGQTKPTFVHRFVVLNTIEETIFNTTSKDMSGKWKTMNVTADNLKQLFVQHRQIN